MLHPEKELAEYLDGELSDDRRPALERHLKRCKRCRRSVDEYRQIQERLRSLDVPPPGEDLTARILRCSRPETPTPQARPTGRGATGTMPADNDPRIDRFGAPVGRSHAGQPGWSDSARAGRSHTAGQHAGLLPVSAAAPAATPGTAGKPSARVVAVIGGVMAGCAVLVLSAAYVLGGEAQTPSPAAGTAWAPVSANAAVMRPVAVDSSGLEALRRNGWTCPLLLGLGYHLQSAEQLLVAGQPAVRLHLSDGSHRVVITEQRRADADREGAGAGEAAPPLNATTGHPVTMDGFQEVAGLGRAVWMRNGEVWTVVLDSEDVTYTLRSDLPLAQMPETVSQVVLTENSRLELPAPAPSDDPLSRIIRGLGMMVSPPASG
ncbi:anti-sigma factor family protein [Arthrobacter sulfonylureivorans]|uniref:anti-sigma factor family protein n=1 Tax=Arthrobacter sulfonylureivorans TaxID=2486855 RepID=UPI0039E2BBD6